MAIPFLMRMFPSLLIAVLGISLSCRNSIPTTPRIIDIQPFTDISQEHTMHVVGELKKIYPHVTLKKAIALPASAYNPERNRYRADSLISFLRNRTVDGHITIGLTKSDISVTKGAVKDWGVMGYGFRPGRSCIVSTFRLFRNTLQQQLFKVAIHELGHTEGLPHCPVKTCFMRDAEGGNPTNEEKEFCTSCRAHLEKRGWKLTTVSTNSSN